MKFWNFSDRMPKFTFYAVNNSEESFLPVCILTVNNTKVLYAEHNNQPVELISSTQSIYLKNMMSLTLLSLSIEWKFNPHRHILRMLAMLLLT